MEAANCMDAAHNGRPKAGVSRNGGDVGEAHAPGFQWPAGRVASGFEARRSDGYVWKRGSNPPAKHFVSPSEFPSGGRASSGTVANPHNKSAQAPRPPAARVPRGDSDS